METWIISEGEVGAEPAETHDPEASEFEALDTLEEVTYEFVDYLRRKALEDARATGTGTLRLGDAVWTIKFTESEGGQ